MSENKYCGNCKSFIPSIDGFGTCTEPTFIYGVHCNNEACSLFKMKSNNGWTEITPDNEHELIDEKMERTIIGTIGNNGRMYTMTLLDCHLGVGTMAKHGGYYYYVLPELKIE